MESSCSTLRVRDDLGEGAAVGNLTVGCRVKSGRAIAVIIDGPRSTPRAVARCQLTLCDPKAAATRQPYHARSGEAQVDQSEIDRLVRIVERCARQAVAELLSSVDIGSACLVVGSVVDPATIGNQHMRAHANEGRLFRTVLEEALRASGIEPLTIVEKQLAAEAALHGISPAACAKTLDSFGRTLGRPWTAEEKAAALGAWIVLSRRR